MAVLVVLVTVFLGVFDFCGVMRHLNYYILNAHHFINLYKLSI
jgi:hypothetical protein